jgi:hypothetical protein
MFARGPPAPEKTKVARINADSDVGLFLRQKGWRFKVVVWRMLESKPYSTIRMSKRSRAILRAIAAGDSFEQILIKDSTVNYHDIFRAAAESGLPGRARQQLTTTQSAAAAQRTWCD